MRHVKRALGGAAGLTSTPGVVEEALDAGGVDGDRAGVAWNALVRDNECDECTREWEPSSTTWVWRS